MLNKEMVGLILLVCWDLKKGENVFTPRTQHMGLQIVVVEPFGELPMDILLFQFNFIKN
jgi:hypothetical protein